MNDVTPHAPPPGAARPSRAELRRQKRHGHQGSTMPRPDTDRSAAGRATVCLCMIVKNEAPVIERCLSSIRPLIDRWLVVDTGSTDGTQDLVRKSLGDLPGELVERPWRDFAHNRSEALALARPSADYSLIIDADDTIDVPAAFRMPVLDADSYTVDVDDPPIRYRRPQLVRNTLAWCYRGVLHEFLSCDGAGQAGHLPLVMRRRHDGARRRDPTTYRRDAELLERALRDEPDPFLRSRYTFYLAQSHRDCGEREQAVARYLERAGLGYWDQEVFVSLYEAAKQMEALGRPDEEVLRTYERATAACPSRIEAAHGAARRCRNAKAFSRGYAIAKAAQGRPMPDAGLFVEPWIYAYGLDDELSVLAYWSGHDRDSAEAAERALASPLLPASERGRLEANRRFALDRLAVAKPAAASAAPAAVGWVPARPQGGTELMVEALRGRLGSDLDAIDLRVNLYDPATRDARPLVMWFHHDIDQAAVQWCRDRTLTDPVARFVFISYWQRERYVSAFGLPPERCVVIKYAMEPAPEPRIWKPAPVFRCAYTSTPFRGLDILLDVWERLPAGRAELHVWSSMKLYTMDDGPYRHLMERAQTMPGVIYHGLAPNAELRAALRTMHFLTYPNTFAETACLSVMEAMSAGCRVIVPSHGVLPETTGGYARIYPWSPDRAIHATTFAEVLEQEFAEPWAGRPGEALDQQAHCATIFAWARRLGEWRQLVGSLAPRPTPRAPSIKSLSEQPQEKPIQTATFQPTVRRIKTGQGQFFITDRDFIGKKLEADGDWEPHIHDFASMVLSERSNAIDLGANIGVHSLTFSRLASSGEIFAFEPVNLCFSQLQMNLVINGAHNVRAFKMAVTDRTGDSVEMEALDATVYGDGVVNIANSRIGQGGDFTFTVRLDDMQFPKIDLIKMDVQGSELVALSGMERLIARDRPVFFVEIEEYHLRRSGTSSKEVIDFFLSRNYDLIRIRTEWPADHVAIPREDAALSLRCRGYNKLPTDWISGSAVELNFDNQYLYSTFTTT